MCGMRKVEASQRVEMGAPRVPCRDLNTLIPTFSSTCLTLNKRLAREI